MILPSQSIQELSSSPTGGKDLVCPFDTDNLRGSSYDLTVGDEYYIGGAADSATLVTQKLKPAQTFTIAPHAVCFVLAAEKIHLPDDVTAKVSLRMPHIYSGMILSSQPPFDPGYFGRVIVMLHNLSSTPLHLKAGVRLATIEFMRVESKPTLPKRQGSVTSIQDQLPKPLVSSLVDIANTSTSALDKVNWLSSQMLVFAALIVAVLAVPGFFSFNSLQDRLADEKDQIKDLQQSLEAFRKRQDESARLIEALRGQVTALTKQDGAQRVLAPKPGAASAPRGSR